MAEQLLRVQGLNKRFGALKANDNIDLSLDEKQCRAVIGPNGAGKTTLVAQLSGTIRADSGTVHLAGVDITTLPEERRTHLGMARSFQITSLFPSFTAFEHGALAAQGRNRHSYRFFAKARNDTTLNEVAAAVLERVGLLQQAQQPAAVLSHGERRRLELAMALASRPRLLLLDEPMAGLGAEESETMTALIASLKEEVTILLVEHDMQAVFKLADQITVLNEGRVIGDGPAEEVRNNKTVRAAYLGEDF